MFEYAKTLYHIVSVSGKNFIAIKDTTSSPSPRLDLTTGDPSNDFSDINSTLINDGKYIYMYIFYDAIL
jgi:hypothetical protein